jgi:hypothetical protein
MFGDLRRSIMIYYDLCVYGNPCLHLKSFDTRAYRRSWRKFLHSRILTEFSAICAGCSTWSSQPSNRAAFRLHFRVIGTSPAARASGDARFLSASRSASPWMLSARFRVGLGLLGLPLYRGLAGIPYPPLTQVFTQPLRFPFLPPPFSFFPFFPSFPARHVNLTS